MKLLKTLSFSLVLAVAAFQAPAVQAHVTPVIYNETPARTIVIKNPMAADINKFFSTGTIFNFEVYKAGSADEVLKMIGALRSDPAVETVSQGVLVGDYLSVTIVLKAAKNKEWFISEFRRAGLTTIRINANPVVAVEKI